MQDTYYGSKKIQFMWNIFFVIAFVFNAKYE